MVHFSTHPKTLRYILFEMEFDASHTKRTQRQSQNIKNIMAKQEDVDEIIELQSDMRGIVIIIIGFVYLASILMYWRVLGSKFEKYRF